MTEQVLSERDIAKLLHLIHNFSDKWYTIGLGLGFTPPELNQIRWNPSVMSAPASFLTELLFQWVQWPTVNHPMKPTLRALCGTLCSSLVGLGSLAEKVEREMKLGVVQHSGNEASSSGSQESVQKKPRSMEVSASVQKDIDSTPTLAELLVLQTPQGKIKITSRIAPYWRELGFLMNFDDNGTEITTIEKKHRGDPKECCQTMFQHWLNGNGVKPCSWRKLIDLIDDCDQEALAKQIQTAFSP